MKKTTVVIHVEDEQEKRKARRKLLELYDEYIKNLKRNEGYHSKMRPEEKLAFNNAYKVKEEIRDGQLMMTFLFNNQEDADRFIEQLKKADFKLTISKETHDDHENEHSSPSSFRRR